MRSPYPIAGTIYGPTKATEPQTAEKDGKRYERAYRFRYGIRYIGIKGYAGDTDYAFRELFIQFFDLSFIILPDYIIRPIFSVRSVVEFHLIPPPLL